MRYLAASVFVVLAAGALVAQQPLGDARGRPAASRYLVTWVGDSDGAQDDFLAVLDVAPRSKTFAQILTSIPSGVRATVPHHTEHSFTPGHPLFANGFAGNSTVRFDLSDPLHPKLLGGVVNPAGLAFPHSFVRLPNGNILATMQASAPDFSPPGGLVEFRDDGAAVRSSSGANDVDPGARLYSMVVLPDVDRIVVSCGRMFTPGRVVASPLDHPGFTIQLWRLSDLRLLKTLALSTPAGARANIERNPYELRRTSGGDILLSTGSGGLFRISGLEPADRNLACELRRTPGAALAGARRLEQPHRCRECLRRERSAPLDAAVRPGFRSSHIRRFISRCRKRSSGCELRARGVATRQNRTRRPARESLSGSSW